MRAFCFLITLWHFFPSQGDRADGSKLLRRELQEACPLQIGVSRCAGLIESTQLEAEEGCDCYQFCGEEYVGCCSVEDEACEINCENVNVIPTAGCRVDGIVDPPPEPVCVANLGNGTRIEFEEGDSFGDLQSSPCGDIADYPCFCSGLYEDDQIRCPYCPFYTNQREFVCARSGEEITFVDEFGIEQTCSCEYTGFNEIQTFCDPQDIPNQVCALQRNTEQCTELTEFMNFDPDCPCMSFCLGEFSGCCNYGESCSVSCPGGATVDDIVSGCTVDPFKPPVTSPPIEPTGAPVAAPEGCVLQVNTENCATATAGQVPVSGCEPDACYNFCDDQFQGCCAADDLECSIQCSGPTQPVITAGCQLEQTCTFFGQSCTEDAECCSKRCLVGRCSRQGPLGAFRTKLGGDRGGAGGSANSGQGFRQLKDEKTTIRGS